MNLSKFVTQGVMRDINVFIEKQKQYPFTMRNVYRMIEIIIGTRQQTYNRALEEVIDNFTRHTHENRYGIEGWKTNSGYMLNKKFIIYEKIDSYSHTRLDDLTKVLCYITGKNYDDIGGLGKLVDNYKSFYNYFLYCDEEAKTEIVKLFKDNNSTEEDLKNVLKNQSTRGTYYISGFYNSFRFFKTHDFVYTKNFTTNTWYKWGFFEFKWFLKGSIHLKFRNEKDWYQLNKAYGELKGFTLADKYNTKPKKESSRKRSNSSNKKTKAKSHLSKQLFELFTSSN